MRPLIRELVRRSGDVDWDRYLALAGLEISSKQKPKVPAKLKHGDERARSYLGIRTKAQGGLVVTQVLAGSPAHGAGLAVRDELIALDGYRLDESKLEKWLGHVGPGRTVRLTIARSGVLRELDVELSDRPLVEFSIQPRKKATTRQRAVCRDWLDERWEKIDRPEQGFDFRPRERIL